jgi:ABC-type antimicrobial peptide transport system permease subunit
LRTLEETVRRVDSNRAVARSYMLADDLSNQTRRDRFFAAATGWFAVLALLLGVFGVNAVIAAMQRRRTREIGLRLALGASLHQASALVLATAARILGLGLAVGMVLAVPVLGALRQFLFGIEPGSFWEIFGLTALVLTTAGMIAAARPAWLASRTAPMEALRYE